MDHIVPEWLGRGVVVGPGAAPPDAWHGLERISVGPAEVAAPDEVVRRMHDAWLARRPLVVELAVPPASLNEAERCDLPPYELTASFTFERERLAFLVWANNYDFRSGELIWWHGRKAERT